MRVDIFYSRLTQRHQALVDIFGASVFLLPCAGFIDWMSKDYVSVAWRVRESSTDPSGLPFVYLLKTTILVLVAMLIIQGISEMLKDNRRFNEAKS